MTTENILNSYLDAEQSTSAQTQEIPFSYLPFTAQDALDIMRGAGFHKMEVLNRKPEYPYLIACGRCP